MNRRKLAKLIYDSSNIKGTFILRSGITSNEYFDKYLFEANPSILKEIAKHCTKLLPNNIDCIAGLEMGAIPIATMISFYSHLPVLFIRKKAKEYGTCKYAEGGEVKGKRILIIEDVVTKAGAIVDAVELLRKDGAIINKAICIIDREDEGRKILMNIGIELIELYKKSEIEEMIK